VAGEISQLGFRTLGLRDDLEAHLEAWPDFLELNLLVRHLVVHVVAEGEEVVAVRERHHPLGIVFRHREQVLQDARHLRGQKREFKLPWREAGPPNHHDDKVDSDQQVVKK